MFPLNCNSVITTDASKARLNTFSQRSHSNQRYPKAWKSWKNSWVSVGLPRWFHMLHALCWNIPEPGISRYAPDMATKIRNNHSISSKTLRSARTTPGQLWMPEKGCEKGVWKVQWSGRWLQYERSRYCFRASLAALRCGNVTAALCGRLRITSAGCSRAMTSWPSKLGSEHCRRSGLPLYTINNQSQSHESHVTLVQANLNHKLPTLPYHCIYESMHGRFNLFHPKACTRTS